MDQAGLKEGDIVVWNRVDILYKTIVYNQEGTVFIPVQRNKQYHEIQVKIPKLKLTIQPDWVYWM
jgi:hypothetical protein